MGQRLFNEGVMAGDEVIDARVPTVVDEPMDFTVIATNPAEMERGQKSMVLWAARKMQVSKQELADAEEQRDIAIRNHWQVGAWKRRVKIAEQRLQFYRKVKIALEAGYYIVPPFPVDIFAIRTNKGWAKWGRSSNKDDLQQHPDILDAGRGEYKSPEPQLQSDLQYGRKVDGTIDYDKVINEIFTATDKLQDVDFPFKMVKPIVMQETAKAMALKVFDQLGILPTIPHKSQPVKQDPIICGQILAPHKGNKPLTFFVAWWLDTRTI